MLLLVALVAPVALAQNAGSGPDSVAARRQKFKQALLANYDLSNPKIDIDKLFAPGVGKDGIPALTYPRRDKAASAGFPTPDGRVIAVEINGEAVAYPLLILDRHEIVNDRVGGVPIAATYCPLCDSVAVFKRTITDSNGTTRELEFGVSGFLYNSNVVMYERSTNGLWSQVLMAAVTGPDAGRSLEYLPVRVMSFKQFLKDYPEGEVLSTKTGYGVGYTFNPYKRYFADPNYIFHKFKFDDRLPPKTLGVGILAGDKAWFVEARSAFKGPVNVKTPKGDVVVVADEAGVRVVDQPKGVATIQTFYHSWSAFHPGTAIVPEPAKKNTDARPNAGG